MSTGPARTPRLAPQQRRAQLLGAALDVLTEDGFGAVTIEAVAQRAGVTRPVVYDLFGDLDSMMVALIDTAEATALTPLLRIVDVQPGDDINPEQFLLESVLAFLKAVKADPRTWRLVLMPPRGSSAELRERIRRSRLLVANHVTRLLDWGVPRRGGPLGVDHALVARLVVAVGEDAARLMLAHPRRFTPQRFTEMIQMFLVLMPPRTESRRLDRLAPRAHPSPAVQLVTPQVTIAPVEGRKRMPQSQRREQLLDIALELLADEGFDTLSMEAIARRAGVNRAVVYRSFANSAVLLVTLLRREDQRIARAIDVLLADEPAGPPAQLLGELLTTFLEMVLAAPSTWRVALLRPESAPLTLQKVVNRRRSLLAAQLQPLVQWTIAHAPNTATPPELGPRDLEALERMLLSICEELARLVLDDPEYPLERVLDSCWAVLDAV